MRKLTVELGDRSYPIYIGPNLLRDKNYLVPHIAHRQVCIVTNSTVAPLYLNSLQELLADKEVVVVELPDGEQYKNFTTLNQIFDSLLSNKHHRTTTLIALGGGVVGDMCGFAAACYQRGVHFIQVPTTLLSQVDSSVGGKTGINHPLGKNMIGAFYQPQAVIIDTQVLTTLPKRELAAGLAEVIKYGLICDADFFVWLENNIDKLNALDENALAYAIERSCQIKANIVAEDEKETGVRAWLNLGHTFGHAIETAQGYGNWLHGEAVAAGMVMAAQLSTRLGWMKEDELLCTINLLTKANLPTKPPRITVEKFLSLMASDKKVLDGNLRLVLLQGIGKCIVTSDFEMKVLKDLLEEVEKN